MKLAAARDCVECGKVGAAYKCPKCRAAYCSVGCCNGHKGRCAVAEVVAPAPLETAAAAAAVAAVDHILPQHQLEALKQNPWLCDALKSKRLFEQIRLVDQAPQRQEALRRARGADPEFDAFVAKLYDEVVGSSSTSLTQERKRKILQELPPVADVDDLDEEGEEENEEEVGEEDDAGNEEEEKEEGTKEEDEEEEGGGRSREDGGG